MVLPLRGESMGPRWASAQRVKVIATTRVPARWGDVVVFERYGRMYAHRLILRIGSRCWTKGDARLVWDCPSPRRDELAGVVCGLLDATSRQTPIRRNIGAALLHLFIALACSPIFLVKWRVRTRGFGVSFCEIEAGGVEPICLEKECDVKQRNVLGTELKPCCYNPRTGFYRDGFCHTGPEDLGLHTVCVRMTAEFLEFSRMRGNDLSTPNPEVMFPGLKPGDCWCLCASRWKEAHDAGVAPQVVLESTNINTLRVIPRSLLEEHAIFSE